MYTGKPALYVNPLLAMEMMQELKANRPFEEKAKQVLDALDSLTNRDLMFYAVGKSVGLRQAYASFDTLFDAPPTEQETNHAI